MGQTLMADITVNNFHKLIISNFNIKVAIFCFHMPFIYTVKCSLKILLVCAHNYSSFFQIFFLMFQSIISVDMFDTFRAAAAFLAATWRLVLRGMSVI